MQDVLDVPTPSMQEIDNPQIAKPKEYYHNAGVVVRAQRVDDQDLAEVFGTPVCGNGKA